MAEVASGVSKIFVRYRDSKPSVDQMREIFSKHGTITDVKLYAKFCFIEYDSETAAEVAVVAENGTVFKGVKLEVETVVRNVQKRKPDETVAEAITATGVLVSKSKEVPSADCVVKKMKQEVLAVDVVTRDLSATETTGAKTAITSKNALVNDECQAQEEMLEDISKSIEAPHFEHELPPTRRSRNHRRHKPKGPRSLQPVNVVCMADEKVLQQSLSPQTSEYRVQSKSQERYEAFGSELPAHPEDKLLSDHARRSSSASRNHGDQPLNSYGSIPAYPDYVPKSLPSACSHQYSSTIYNWSGYLPAEQTYTTAYPHADSQSYSSNYTAECLQVNACRTGTSFYGGHEKTDIHSLKQADTSRITQSVQPWNDAQMIQEGYSMRGNPSGLGKGDHPHLPDLVNYPSVAKSSMSDLTARESRDLGYGPCVESGKISMSRGTTSSSQAVSSVSEYQGHERSNSAIEHTGICEVIITEPNLRQYGLKVASKIHSTGLKVEICNLPPGMTVLEEVEDALIRGLLFAVVITERHVEHNSVTVDVLHGVAEEHRNMVLDDAVRLIASSYQEYIAAKRATSKSSPISEPLKSKADMVPDERTQMLITGLARNQHLTYEELEEIITYLRKRQEVLRKESNVLGSLSGQSTALPQQEDSVDVTLQKKLEATIFSILKGESPVQQQATSTKRTHPGFYPPSGHYVEKSGEPYASDDSRRY